MEQRVINVNGVKLANNLPFGLLCGPCPASYHAGGGGETPKCEPMLFT